MRFWHQLKTQDKNRLKVLVVVLVFSAVGFRLLSMSSAATTSVSVEAENGQRTTNVVVADSSAASGGKYIQFKATTPPPTGTTPVAINGMLSICGVQICNQYGKPIQLRGMSTHGIQWYGWGSPSETTCINDASLDALANDWKADVLRVSLYVQEDGYETNPTAFTAMADKIIDAAIARGIYVLIDWHQLDPGDPNYNTTAAKTYFSHMAQRYKNVPNVLYEIANEPNGVNWSTIKSYADTMVPHIRAIDPNGIIIIGTPGWDTFGLSGEGPASDVYNNKVSGTNLMYTFHFYAASHTASYLAQLDEASSRAPVFVTEWGTQDSSGDGSNNFTMSQQYIDLMAQKKISWTSWNYSDDSRSGAAWTSGTCPNGPWTTNRLKAAGAWVRERILTPADSFPTN